MDLDAAFRRVSGYRDTHRNSSGEEAAQHKAKWMMDVDKMC